MAIIRNPTKPDITRYSPHQVKAVLSEIGLQVRGENEDTYSMLCPYHNNSTSYVFYVNKIDGTFVCFNAGCGEFGSLAHLVENITNRNHYEALRLIAKKGGETVEAYENDLMEAAKPFTFTPWEPDTLKALSDGMTTDSLGMQYMLSRGFTEDTVKYFEIGYSNQRAMVTVPVHSPDGICVGIVGRSIEGKSFKNSKGLPRRKTLFNIHRAKRVGDVVIVCEASFDAMRVHQAGFPNVVAVLGGKVSKEAYALLERMFSTVIIMADADKPGRELGKQMAGVLRYKNVMWASYGHKQIYPDGAKDAGEMTDRQINRCINNAVTDFEYLSWGLD